MDIKTITPFYWRENEENCSNLLKDQSLIDTIPLLNVNKLEQLGNSKLVRFIGMIQDMHTPEYYLEKFEVVNKITNENSWLHSKYEESVAVNDNEYINFDNISNVTSERQTFVVISVPAVNTWVNVYEEKSKVIPENCAPMLSSKKRVLEETMDVEDPCCASNSNIQNKKICNNNFNRTESKFIPNRPNDIFPLPTDTNQVYHVKLYGDQEVLKINDVCEFIGFLDMDPSVNANRDDNDMDTDGATCFIPKIHCTCFRKIVHGDTLAAEYLLLHLISRVYLRREGLALGKLSLNISKIPELANYPNELYKFIEKIVPKSVYLPMTLENLNDLTFIPKKDYELNYLSSGVLQLSENTHFVLDETKLTPGKLNSAGISNIKAISDVIKNQSIAYDFKYYPLEFNCDIPFLILSEGKSMINSDVHVTLEPDPMCTNTFKEIIEAAEHFLKPDLLNDVRKYLTISRMSDYSITEQNEEFIQNEFVKMRQIRSNVTADDLHSMLIISRLVSISEGKGCFDKESWEKAFKMEEERNIRIKNLRK
ncbi:mini-chromosome maintenance complex-binding protein [Diorhabda carinulata]|uniref:mini-chromosome maintenance complex-binding protein n=1 Tax=Diorhabda carinulata TaxID=1163345 RepID=UPI0025A216DA|nr:mini-chromosome maintenance complex-binding protein [Diorhabda carinulata]